MTDLDEVLGRINEMDRTTEQHFTTQSLELRALSAEVRTLGAELRLEIINLKQDLRDLWTEHLGHIHPDVS